MKKIILILVIVTLVCLLTACNYRVFDFKYNFTHAYVKVGNTWTDLEVEKWTNHGEQLQLTLKDGTVLVVNSMNCILYNGTLPATNGNESLEQLVIEDACKELEVSSDGATLELVSTEYVPWLGCNVYNYILTLADGSKWSVGARENEDGFYADVEYKL